MILPAEINRALGLLAHNPNAFVTNVWPKKHAAGWSVEGFSSEVLARLRYLGRDTSDREHVTPPFYRDAASFQALPVPLPLSLDSLRGTLFEREGKISFVIDDHADLKVMEYLVAVLEDPVRADASVIVRAAERAAHMSR